MSIQTSINGNIFIVQPIGDINMQVAIEFESLIIMAIDDGYTNVVFDFAEMHHISSDGLHVILKIIRILTSKHGIVIATAMNDSVRSVFETSGFMSLIDEFETVEQAINAINDDAS
jgi:anti-anti-sigma factor